MPPPFPTRPSSDEPALTAVPAGAALRATSLQWLDGTTRSLLTDILVGGPRSRADLARSSGWSPASMTRISRRLLEARLLVEANADTGGDPYTDRPARTGRPSSPLDVDADLVHLIGINLTGSTLTLIRTDLRATQLELVCAPLVSHDPVEVVDQIATAVDRQLAADPHVQLLGVSLAGPVAPDTRVLGSSAFLDWAGVPLVSMLEDRTGLVTTVDNDVRALTAAEHWFGAAAGLSNFAVITIGAGIGCGIVVDNHLVEGLAGGSGHIGHLPISGDGPICDSGHRGCARSYLASSSIVGQLAGLLHEPDLTYARVVELVAAGHPLARLVAESAAVALGRLIGMVSSFIAPERVLISGDGVELITHVQDVVRGQAEASRHWSVRPTTIEITPFSSTEWARGAAVSALRRHIGRHADVDTPRT